MENVSLVILYCDMRGFARMAVALGSRMPAFVQEFYEAMGEEIPARWGIHFDCDLEVSVSAGPVTRGLFGHRSLRTLDVMGETVNEAAVLTRCRGVAVTGPVNAALGDAFRTEPLPDVPLKWRDEPLRAWRVLEGS